MGVASWKTRSHSRLPGSLVLTVFPPHLLPSSLHLMCRIRVVDVSKVAGPHPHPQYFSVFRSAADSDPPPDAQGNHRCAFSPSTLPSFSNNSKYSGEGKKGVTAFYLIAEHWRGDCLCVLIAGAIGGGECVQDHQSAGAGGRAFAGCLSRNREMWLPQQTHARFSGSPKA